MAIGFLHRANKSFANEKENAPTSSTNTSQQQIPFALATPGQTVEVISVRGKDDTRRFLANLGFVEGATVSIVSENGGNIIASVKDSRVAISQTMAMRIMVA